VGKYREKEKAQQEKNETEYKRRREKGEGNFLTLPAALGPGVLLSLYQT
jgi:hypothetical protein